MIRKKKQKQATNMDSAPDLPPVVAYMQFVKETATHAKVKEDFELYMNDAKQCVGYSESPAVAFPLTLCTELYDRQLLTGSTDRMRNSTNELQHSTVG